MEKPLPLGVVKGPIPLGVVMAQPPLGALRHVAQLEMVVKPTPLEGLLFHYGILEVMSSRACSIGACCEATSTKLVVPPS
jgi:hypothetical protein